MSKSVEEALSKAFEAFETWAENHVRPYGPDEMRIARQAYLAGHAAGAAHDAAVERRWIESIINLVRGEYGVQSNHHVGHEHDECHDCVMNEVLSEIEARIRQRGEGKC